MAKHPYRKPAERDLDQSLAQERCRRIEVLGGFGAKRTQVVRDRTMYNRREKFRNSGPQGPFAFLARKIFGETVNPFHGRFFATQ